MPKKTIDGLLADEMPYEKCKKAGPASLTDPELLAVFLRTGLSGVDVLKLSREILSAEEDGLYGLVHKSVKELLKLRGIGEVKAVQLTCLLELALRIQKKETRQRLKMNNPSSIADYYMEELCNKKTEELWAAFFDTKFQFLGDCQLSRGTSKMTPFSPKQLMREALKCNASAMVLLHNHPSGDPSPSPEDADVTKKALEAGRLMEVTLADHIVIGDHRYYSYSANGLLR